MNIRPLRNNIVVRPIALDRVTESGLIIPDTVKPKNYMPDDSKIPYFNSHCLTGEVIAVGPGKHDKKGNLIPVEVSVGDTVQYSMNGAKPLDGDLVMISEDSVVGFVG